MKKISSYPPPPQKKQLTPPPPPPPKTNKQTNQTRCTYDSSQNTHTVRYGPTIQDEMCLAMLYYYPAAPDTFSLSCFDFEGRERERGKEGGPTHPPTHLPSNDALLLPRRAGLLLFDVL